MLALIDYHSANGSVEPSAAMLHVFIKVIGGSRCKFRFVHHQSSRTAKRLLLQVLYGVMAYPSLRGFSIRTRLIDRTIELFVCQVRQIALLISSNRYFYFYFSTRNKCI